MKFYVWFYNFSKCGLLRLSLGIASCGRFCFFLISCTKYWSSHWDLMTWPVSLTWRLRSILTKSRIPYPHAFFKCLPWDGPFTYQLVGKEFYDWTLNPKEQDNPGEPGGKSGRYRVPGTMTAFLLAHKEDFHTVLAPRIICVHIACVCTHSCMGVVQVALLKLAPLTTLPYTTPWIEHLLVDNDYNPILASLFIRQFGWQCLLIYCLRFQEFGNSNTRISLLGSTELPASKKLKNECQRWRFSSETSENFEQWQKSCVASWLKFSSWEDLSMPEADSHTVWRHLSCFSWD